MSNTQSYTAQGEAFETEVMMNLRDKNVFVYKRRYLFIRKWKLFVAIIIYIF